MRATAGILMIVGAVVFAAIGFGTLLSQPVLLEHFDFFRALPALLVLLVAFFLGFRGYNTLKKNKFIDI